MSNDSTDDIYFPIYNLNFACLSQQSHSRASVLQVCILVVYPYPYLARTVIKFKYLPSTMHLGKIEEKITLPIQNQAHTQSKNSHKRRHAPPHYGEKFNFPNFVFARNDYSDWLPVYGGRLPNVQLGRKSIHIWRLLRNTWEITISLRSVTLRCHYGGSLHRPLQIRLGNESCDQISASPNRPKRAKSRDSRDKSRGSCDKNAPPPRKIAGRLCIHVYTLFEFSQTKRYFSSFLEQNIQRQMIHQHHYRLPNKINVLLKTR